MNAALVPVKVDGWTLYQDASSDWLLDVDLGAEVDQSRPRDIRPVVRKAIADRLVFEDQTIAGGARDGLTSEKQGSRERARATGRKSKVGTIAVTNGDGPLRRPLVRTVIMPQTIGSGASRLVNAYLLNREAAVVVLFQLRTPRAKELQTTFLSRVLHVFDLAGRARVVNAPALPAPSGLTIDQVSAMLDERFALERAKRAERSVALNDELKKLREGLARVEFLDRLIKRVPELFEGLATVDDVNALRAELKDFVGRTTLSPATAVAIIAQIDERFAAASERFAELEAGLLQKIDGRLAGIPAALDRRANVPDWEMDFAQRDHGRPDIREPEDMPIPTERGRAFVTAVEAPGALDRHHHLTHPAMYLIARVLARHCDSEGHVTMTQQELADRAPVHLMTAPRVLARLVACGLLEIAVKRNGRPRGYRLLPVPSI